MEREYVKISEVSNHLIRAGKLVQPFNMVCEQSIWKCIYGCGAIVKTVCVDNFDCIGVAEEYDYFWFVCPKRERESIKRRSDSGNEQNETKTEKKNVSVIVTSAWWWWTNSTEHCVRVCILRNKQNGKIYIYVRYDTYNIKIYILCIEQQNAI